MLLKIDRKTVEDYNYNSAYAGTKGKMCRFPLGIKARPSLRRAELSHSAQEKQETYQPRIDSYLSRDLKLNSPKDSA